jgi:hypothetical protein
LVENGPLGFRMCMDEQRYMLSEKNAVLVKSHQKENKMKTPVSL